VNATSGYSKYGLVSTKAAGSSTSVNVGEWRIFAESFAIDGGIMNTTAQISLDNGIQSNLEVGTANLFVDVTTSNVGIGTNAPLARLDVHGTANVGALTASSGTVTGDLTVQGDFTVTGTTVTLDQQNLTIRDPIIEIGKDNLVTPVNDLGLIMTRPSGGNVAIIYDETTSNLEIGYTLGNAEETEITMDTGNSLDVNINGNLSVANTFTIQSFTLGQTFDLDSVTAVGGDSAQAINITDTTTSTNKTTGALKVAGGVGVVGNVYAGKNVDVGANLTVGENLTVGTANLFVDTTTGNLGIGRTDPRAPLDINSTGAMIVPVGTTAEQPGTAYNGMVRYNASTSRIEYYNGGWVTPGIVAATGGTVSTSGDYRIHTFTTSDDFVVTNGGTVEYFMVGGGGSGSAGRHDNNVPGGGGGAGGVIQGSITVSPGTYAVVVGDGGAAALWLTSTGREGNPGSDTTFNSLTALGGGRGRLNNATSDGNGGSGGGSGGGGSHGIRTDDGQTSKDGGYGLLRQGHHGGKADPYTTNGTSNNGGGGGGGAGAPGGHARSATGGNGGDGLASSISGSSVTYGGGGGGAGPTSGSGGSGGGGSGSTGSTNGASGTANTGGGGGGNRGNGGGSSGAGGSGIVIIRYVY
jgi:hypothetical protein